MDGKQNQDRKRSRRSQVSYSSGEPRADQPYRDQGRDASGEVDWQNRPSVDPEELGFDQDDWERFNRNLDIATDDLDEQNRPRGSRSGAAKDFYGVGPQGFQRTDERIFEEVCERFTMHGHLDARKIRPDVSNGIVTLSGEVDSRAAKRLAEDIASGILGVHDVENRLKVSRQ